MKKRRLKLASLISKKDLSVMATSKRQAHHMEVKHYFDGNPCLSGHIATRSRSSGMCQECVDIGRDRRMAASTSKEAPTPKTFYIPFLQQSVQILSSNLR